MKISKKNILPFMGFFLITVGNGKYISDKYGFFVEYMGLVFLILCILMKIKIRTINIKKCTEFIILCVLLCLGSFVQNASYNTKNTMVFTSILLVLFSLFSGEIIDSNIKIKLVGKAVLCGSFFTIAIGIITNTLEFVWGFKDSFVGLLFLAGFSVKNYCGGVWLVIFICYYIYFYREGIIEIGRAHV